MEKIENLPSEIQWKIIKFMRHPVAEIFKNEIWRSIVPRDMTNNGLNREPYKIVWKKRNFRHAYNIAFCDQPKHKNSNVNQLVSDEEDDADDLYNRGQPDYDPGYDPRNDWDLPESDANSDDDDSSDDDDLRP